MGTAFDRYELSGSLELRPSGESADGDTRPVWSKNLPKSWKAAQTYFPDHQLGIALTIPKPDILKTSVNITGVNNNSGLPPAVTAAHYKAGAVPGTYPQKIVFSCVKRYKEYYTKVRAEAQAYMYKNLATIKQTYSCPSNQTIQQCLCANYNSVYTTPSYSPGFKDVAADCSPDTSNLNNVCYPVQFIYTLPGTQTRSAIITINLEKN